MMECKLIVDLSPSTLLGEFLRGKGPQGKLSRKLQVEFAEALCRFAKDVRSGKIIVLSLKGGPMYLEEFPGNGYIERRPSKENYFTINFTNKDKR